MTGADITHAELEQHYLRTSLPNIGINFERALASVPIRRTLEGAARAARAAAARQASPLSVQRNQQEAA
jgi:hypothetical protein